MLSSIFDLQNIKNCEILLVLISTTKKKLY